MPASLWATALSTALSIVLPVAIAALGWRVRALSVSGALAASAVGMLALRAGAPWGTYLIAWFVVASLLTRAGRRVKSRRLAGLVEKAGARQASQVLANGLVFTLCAAGQWVEPSVLWPTAGAAALAAAGADTWGTEIGTWARANAWSLRTANWVPAGTSGAITPLGTLGTLAGAVGLAVLAVGTGLVSLEALPAVAIGGVGGALADTVIGAWAQERRWCDACATATEAGSHACGASTRVVGGIPGLQNDLVNLLATVTGAAIAVAAVG